MLCSSSMQKLPGTSVTRVANQAVLAQGAAPLTCGSA